MENIITYHIEKDGDVFVSNNLHEAILCMGCNQDQVEHEDRQGHLPDLGEGVLLEFKVTVKRCMTLDELMKLPEYQ